MTRPAGTSKTLQGHSRESLPNSKSTGSSKFKAPPNACDSHIHVVDNRRFPTSDGSGNADSSVDAYRLAQQRIGTTRTVVVTPRPYVTDNRCTLDAISQLGVSAARGIAVVRPNITDAELTRLADGGICGIRFTVGGSAAVTSIDMIEPLAKRIQAFGWHLQLHMLGDQIAEHAGLLQRLELPIVFDHMGRLPPPAGIKHPAFKVICGLLDQGRTWVKLSGAILHDSSNHRLPTPAELSEIAQAYLRAAPERMVWGSDWPHGGDKGMPDDVERFDEIAQWTADDAIRRGILVDNPQALYGF